jgi:tetratricopeptide (TPR) repeat protein
MQLGLAALQQHDYPTAIAHLGAAKDMKIEIYGRGGSGGSLHPDLAGTLKALAQALQESGRLDEAKAMYTRAHALYVEIVKQMQVQMQKQMQSSVRAAAIACHSEAAGGLEEGAGDADSGSMKSRGKILRGAQFCAHALVRILSRQGDTTSTSSVIQNELLVG